MVTDGKGVIAVLLVRTSDASEARVDPTCRIEVEDRCDGCVVISNDGSEKFMSTETNNTVRNGLHGELGRGKERARRSGRCELSTRWSET